MDGVLVHTIYCDDIRHEMGNKLSIMGIYNSDLLLLDFPTTLPKFCAQVNIRFPIETEAKSLSIKLATNEKVLFELPMPEGELQKMKTSIQETKDDSKFINVGVVIQLTPLELQQETAIRTFAYVDGTEIKGNGIRVRKPTEEERIGLQIPASPY